MFCDYYMVGLTTGDWRCAIGCFFVTDHQFGQPNCETITKFLFKV